MMEEVRFICMVRPAQGEEWNVIFWNGDRVHSVKFTHSYFREIQAMAKEQCTDHQGLSGLIEQGKFIRTKFMDEARRMLDSSVQYPRSLR